MIEAGDRFGGYTVVDATQRKAGGKTFVLVECDCGYRTQRNIDSLQRNKHGCRACGLKRGANAKGAAKARTSEQASKAGRAARKASPWGGGPMVSTLGNHARHERFYGKRES